MRRSPRATCTLLAALSYLEVALWNYRAVLPDPRALLPHGESLTGHFLKLGRLDQAMVVGVIAGNAHRLIRAPATLRGEGPCHPLPDAYTLGEHMLGESLLAAVPFALSGDPVLTYNLVLLATLVIPALAMYALALHFTRSAPAAFVAGLLFCVEPVRILDTGHPFVHGNLWTPLALLFLHRTLARGGIGNALGVASFTGLGVLESLYSLLGSLLVLALYGAYAAWVHRDRWRRWLAPLAGAAVAVGALAWVVLEPYLAARATWGGFQRPGSIFMPPATYGPGQIAFPGWILLALVALALVDRLARGRRAEEGEDPRLALLAGAALVLWASVHSVPLPGGLALPSPLLVAKRFVPGLDAVRALASVGYGAGLPLALIAAYGVVALSTRLRRRGAIAVPALLCVAILAERWVPAAARATFGTTFDLTAHRARPPEEDIRLLREHARGALLDIPYFGDTAGSLVMAEDVLFASYSPRPTAACYNSFPSPIAGRVATLAGELPSPSAADALAALGFGTVLVHVERASPRGPGIFMRRVEQDPAIAQRLTLAGRTERLLAFHLASPVPVSRDVTRLGPAPIPGPTPEVEPGRRRFALPVRNLSPETFRHPDPIAPTEVEARWHAASGDLVRSERVRTLLPLALAANADALLEVELETPPPGIYGLTLHPASQPGHVLAEAAVAVREG